MVTPADACITFPLRTVLSKPGGRWVVAEPDGGGHYDGLTGLPLVWDETAGYAVDRDASETEADARAAPTPSTTFLREPAVLGSHLLIDLTAVHPATDGLVLGGAAESLARTFARAAPAGWGTSEPALAEWDRPTLTATCRRRAPRPSWSVFVGEGGETRPSSAPSGCPGCRRGSRRASPSPSATPKTRSPRCTGSRTSSRSSRIRGSCTS